MKRILAMATPPAIVALVPGISPARTTCPQGRHACDHRHPHGHPAEAPALSASCGRCNFTLDRSRRPAALFAWMRLVAGVRDRGGDRGADVGLAGLGFAVP